MKDKIAPVPNIIMWSWMRTVLKLCGSELLLFSYIFSQSFDNVHKCYTCMTDMEYWFGITRQTISRNVDKLCDKKFIIKETLIDKINPIIKHNNYKVNIEYITEICENSDYSSYQNFLDSYKFILRQKFPEDSSTIEDCIDQLLSWHKNKSMKVCLTLNELAKIIYHSDTEDNLNISDILQIINSNKKGRRSAEKTYIQKESVSKSKTLFSTKPVKSKKALHNEWDVTKREMNHNFVYMRFSGNVELLELLNHFLETDNGKSYTPIQWEQQLENLYKYGRTLDRMVEGVRTSFMNNYRSLYPVDKTEVDIDKKLDAIDVYATEINDDGRLKKLLYAYIMEVPKGRSQTINQFNLSLKRLNELCPTLEQKVKSVETSYANSYSALAYPNSYTSSEEVVDQDKKISYIKKFISDGYYQLCDGLEENLMIYVKDTTNGKSMSYSHFKVILDNLRLFCLNDDEKVSKVLMAIQNNSTKFVTEDFSETRKLRDKSETRESKALSMDRSRRARIIKEKNLHPNNPKLLDVIIR